MQDKNFEGKMSHVLCANVFVQCFFFYKKKRNIKSLRCKFVVVFVIAWLF